MPTFEVSLDEQIECVDRELAFRAKVYPRWVNASKPKMTPAAAEREMKRMRAVRESLVAFKRLLETAGP